MHRNSIFQDTILAPTVLTVITLIILNFPCSIQNHSRYNVNHYCQCKVITVNNCNQSPENMSRADSQNVMYEIYLKQCMPYIINIPLTAMTHNWTIC
jgi:hypothetical protein